MTRLVSELLFSVLMCLPLLYWLGDLTAGGITLLTLILFGTTHGIVSLFSSREKKQ